MTKTKIIKNLRKNQKQIDEIISNFESLETSDSRVKIVFTMFELIDSISNTEVEVYNYLRSL